MNKLNVIYEDNHIIVVEKTPNIPSQSDKTGDMDMITIVKQYIKEKYNKTGNVYLGLVHRLDRPVGGIMIFAKTSKAAGRLSEQVRNKTFKKKYLAVVDGKIDKRYICDFGITLDERIADGVYFAKSLNLLEYILNNPSMLEDRASDKISID